jgi:hypothetical protein
MFLLRQFDIHWNKDLFLNKIRDDEYYYDDIYKVQISVVNL